MTGAIGVTISAWIMLFVSFAGLVSSGLVLFVSFIRVMDPGTSRGLAVLFGIPGIVSLLGVATAVGLFRRRRWARIVTLLFAPLLLIGGILLTVLFVWGNFLSSELNPYPVASTAVMILVFFLPMILIGLWWLFLFNQPSVKAEFVT